MLNDEDIKKLSSILATKSDLDTFKSEVKLEFNGVKKDISDLKSEVKEVKSDLESKFLVLNNNIQEVKKDVEGLREAIQGMMVSVDNLAKVISDLRLEYAGITKQLNKHENWIKQIAEKVGLNLAVE
jgi:archaellum component FlaC